MALAVARGLCFMHENGVIHRQATAAPNMHLAIPVRIRALHSRCIITLVCRELRS